MSASTTDRPRRGDRGRRCGRAIARVLAGLVVVVSLGCSGTSPTRELDHDASRDTIAGPRPTAPPSTDYHGPGLSSDATELMRQLRELEDERNLCEILTSKTVGAVMDGDIELSGLVTTPSGVAQMLVVLDSFFAHLVEVSPPAIGPSMAVIQDVWKKLASIDVDAGDREARTRAIVDTPQVQAAVSNVGAWTEQNCLGRSGPSFDLDKLISGIG